MLSFLFFLEPRGSLDQEQQVTVSSQPAHSPAQSSQQVGHSSQTVPGGGAPPLGDPQAGQQVIDLLIANCLLAE